MKLVTTITENNSINVQRFENDIKVGERDVRLVDYCYSLMQQLPMGAIMEHLVESEDVLKTYLENLEDSNDFDKFLITLFKNLNNRWYEENPAFLNFLSVAMNRLQSVTVDNPYIIGFLTTIVKKGNQLPLESDMATLVIEILKRLLIESNSEELEKKKVDIFKAVISTLQSEQQDELKNAITHIIPHLDDKWFNEMMFKAQSATNKKVTFFSGQIPKGVAHMSVNSHGTSFVYEVPKAKIRVKYHTVPIYDVGHPRLLAIYELKDNKIWNMKIVAVKEHEAIHDDMEVYHYPYAHVFPNGSVCWSEYGRLTIDDLPQAANMFLSSNNSNHGRKDCFELYKENEGKDFDDSKLNLLGSLKELL